MPSVDRRTDLTLKIVFIDRPRTAVRILAGASIMDGFIDHVPKSGLSNSCLKLACSRRRTIGPMPRHDMLQCPTRQHYLSGTALDLSILSRLTHQKTASH